MNLADYLSELLGIHDEVNVPDLGYFVRTRVNAHYNDSDGRFYPPYHQVRFVPQPKDDDTFARYVADKKNISLASSKYFIEKFIAKLKEDAAKGRYLFADLGSFQTDLNQLLFRPNDRIPADPAFYGYPSVNIFKAGQPLSVDTKKPVFAQTKAAATGASAAYIAPPARTFPGPQFYEEETEPKRGINVWFIILISLSIIALAIFGIYKFYPSVFHQAKGVYDKFTGKTAVVIPVLLHQTKTDSAKKMFPANDTTANNVSTTTPLADTVNQSHFEIIVGNFSNPLLADAAVKLYRDRGIKARTLTLAEAPGPLIKVSAGSFHTNDKAQSTMLELIKKGKIMPSSYTIEIKPQQ